MNRISNQFRKNPLQGIRILILSLILGFIFFPAGISAAETWQPVDARSWVHTDIPPGWSSSIEKNETISPDSVIITAYAPDKNTRITYNLEHNQDILTKEAIQKFQSEYMSTRGFRVCMTKDPIEEEKNGTIIFRQTYVRGTGDAAVISTLMKPGWGQAHYILVMEGPQAVADNYESIPVLIQDHISPVSPDETGA